MPERARSLRRAAVILAAGLAAVLLSGCLLISGPVQSSDATPDGGNVYLGFVSAEGDETRVVATNFPNQTLEVTVMVQNQRGQMRIEILDPENSVAVAVEGQAEDQTRIGTVRTNPAGEFRFRLRATGAQRGAIQILYQPSNG